MSLSANYESVSQKRTLSSILADHVVKKPKQVDEKQLQQVAIQLLQQQQDLNSLLQEAGDLSQSTNGSLTSDAKHGAFEKIPNVISCSMMVSDLRHQAAKLGVPVAALSVKTILGRLKEIIDEREDKSRPVLTSSQRVKLCELMEFSRDFLSQGAFSPKLLWKEYRQGQEEPHLEVVHCLHSHNVLTVKEILESDEGVKGWLVSRLKDLCCLVPLQEEDKKVQHLLMSTLVGVLVETGFSRDESTAADKKLVPMCRSILDNMLFWLMEGVNTNSMPEPTKSGAKLWSEIYDASLCEAAVSPDALKNFFMHSLTQTLTYKPRLTVSDAVLQQNQWTFPKASRLLTSVFCKLAVVFDVQQLLRHLQQVLETHEVNWKNVLCFLSTLLVYNHSAQCFLKEMLSRLLTSAFESYDLENMITAFLLARQAALEGPAIFLSYSEWFKVSFGGANSFHASSKKSLVFLLKFLSDLVPFEPPQYLKVHILHPPYVTMKHRSLLMDYVSLAKTRLADLKESVEMSLYEGVFNSGETQEQAEEDVEKAMAVFETTGRISSTIMEASIFRRPYFLNTFLPALLKSRLLPVKPDVRMSFIKSLEKAGKIPAAQYSSYIELCEKLRRHDGGSAYGSSPDDPLQIIYLQLQELRGLIQESDGEMSAQLSRVAHTLGAQFPDLRDDSLGQRVIKLSTDSTSSSELQFQVVDMILRVFCQCLLDSSQTQPPDKQSTWASTFVSVLLSNNRLLSSFLHRLWYLLHHQGSSLKTSHLLGLAALLVHLNVNMSHNPLVQLSPSKLPVPVSIIEALTAALICCTRADMIFCIRFCLAAVCYGMCRGASSSQHQSYVPIPSYKKLLYLIPRLLPECRQSSPAESVVEYLNGSLDMWSSATDGSNTWRRTALSLWRHPLFRQLRRDPQYQLSVTEWLSSELQVSRSEDALTDPERLEYHQWACLDHYLLSREEEGGCGGDTRRLIAYLLNAVMEHQLSRHSLQKSNTCLSDILCRLQDLLVDVEIGGLYCRRPETSDISDFLFELVCQRLSVTDNMSFALVFNTWNRVLLALPSVCFIKAVTIGGRLSLDCNSLIKHINLHQRRVCEGGLSVHVTRHFLKGLLCASARCGYSEFNKCWSQIGLQCPLLLVSTILWWDRLSAVVKSQLVCNGNDLPEQLQLLSSTHEWACSVSKGEILQMPPASSLMLAAALYAAWRRRPDDISSTLSLLRLEKEDKHREVLVYLLFLAVNTYLSATLHHQESPHCSQSLCSQVLTRLLDSSDWLLIFKQNVPAAYKPVTMLSSDALYRLMPWAFFSLLLQQNSVQLLRASSCPGFLLTALPCYLSLLQLFLDEPLHSHTQVLSGAKHFLLKCVTHMSAADSPSSVQLAQLESLCAGLDPEVGAALSAAQQKPSNLSPEMDFL